MLVNVLIGCPEVVFGSCRDKCLSVYLCNGKGKAIPLQVLTDPQGSRRSRLPDFKTVGT
jgi:hypothetical protein